MMAAITGRRDEIRALCERFEVDRLFLCGSSAMERERSDSDADFRVEFKAEHDLSYDDRYFGLLDALEALLGRRVDLVVDSAIKNPYYRESIARSKVALPRRKWINVSSGPSSRSALGHCWRTSRSSWRITRRRHPHR